MTVLDQAITALKDHEVYGFDGPERLNSRSSRRARGLAAIRLAIAPGDYEVSLKVSRKAPAPEPGVHVRLCLNSYALEDVFFGYRSWCLRATIPREAFATTTEPWILIEELATDEGDAAAGIPLEHVVVRAVPTPGSEEPPVQDGFAPLPKSFLRELQPGDRFLAAYPRSGSRWVRLLLADLVYQRRGLDTGLLYGQQHHIERGRAPDEDLLGIDDVVPTAHYGWWRCQRVAAEMQPVFRIHAISQVMSLPAHRIVYMFRHPAAALISYYHYTVQVAGPNTPPIDEFCRAHVVAWQRHLELALASHERDPGHMLLVNYAPRFPLEDDDARRICGFLDLRATDAQLRSALERMRNFFAELRAAASPHPRGTDPAPGDHLLPDTVEQLAPGLETYHRAQAVARAQSNRKGYDHP